ncbi:MAG: arylsulfotransferase family protein [Paracoccaceae bacterium]
MQKNWPQPGLPPELRQADTSSEIHKPGFWKFLVWPRSRAIFVFSGIFLLTFFAFSLGTVSVRKNWIIWQKAKEAQNIVKSLYKTGKILPDRSFYPRARYASNRQYTVFNNSAVSAGELAITRLNPDTGLYVIDLLDTDGTVLHTWPIRYSRLVAGGSNQEFAHGTKVMRDGSVLVEFNDGAALARLDVCGEPIWVKSGDIYHHIIQAGAKGYWTWQSAIHSNSQDQKLARFDPETGETLETIDLVDDVIRLSPATALLAAIPPGFTFERRAWDWSMSDIFHPNDIEPLPAEIAGAFPQFSPGDLLISLRNLNLVAVLERRTHRILWSAHGPWFKQHDPDWQRDGTITVFSNNPGRQRSDIVRIDPKTNVAKLLFGDGGPRFYSDVMGAHEKLPNGNWLILSATEGRVIEVTADGGPVREYSNILNKKYNAVVPFAEHLPPGYFSTIPECGL